MQGAKRKITKKELKEDNLVLAYYKARNFLEKNLKRVAIGVGAVLAIAVLIGLMINSKIQANKTAGYELYKAALLIEQSQYQEAVQSLNTMMDTYPGTRNASEGLLALARAHLQLGNNDSTIYYADKFLKKHNGSEILICTGYALKAAALEDESKFVEAAECYIKAVNKYPKNYTAPIYLVDAGRCYTMAKMDKEAQEVFNRVIDEYPESQMVGRANDQIARTGAVPKKLPPKPMKLF